MLDNAQSNVGTPADSLIDKIGRSLRERSGSVGANGEPSTVWQGKQKASVAFQQKQPPTQKTKQAGAQGAAVPKATIVVEPAALAPAPAPAQLDKPVRVRVGVRARLGLRA